MTELVIAIEKASQILLDALDKARSRKEEGEEYFRRAAAAYIELAGAVAAMRVYGRINPATYERVMKPIFEELHKSLGSSP
ncbi:MAG: hypothetical protein AOA65_0248 [Candidatus Bathyarchaeota archaeon BA1]|nr:MAG: hypothetical protein AOA65_0248 [Candidatus Bathyarchaeota archaeon BA1]